MKRLREKLKSQSGASILLAILFFAVCAMAAASILMAASSNAGKIRNNREAQQRYLTLSSALNLICDELMQSSYTGKYDVVYTPPVYEGEETKEIKVPESYSFVQQNGEFASNMSGEYMTNDVLPMRGELDWLYAKMFEEIKGANISGTPVSNGVTALKSHVLTVKADGHKDVTVTVELLPGYSIRVTAVLADEGTGEHKMAALLDLDGEPPKVDITALSGGETAYTKPMESRKVSWQLTWVSKEVAAGSEIEGGS